jgi:ribosomal protein L6P/L9E
MSRVGGKAIAVPSGVKVKLGADRVEIEGGKLLDPSRLTEL